MPIASATTGNQSRPLKKVTHSPTPPVDGVVSAHFACSVLIHGWSPPPLPVGLAGLAAQAAAELGVAAGRPGRVRDPAAVGMIRLAGLAGPAAATLAEEIPTLDENSGMRWALPEDTPGRIGPFNPGIRRDRSGP